jgi:hypothetical protein
MMLFKEHSQGTENNLVETEGFKKGESNRLVGKNGRLVDSLEHETG